MVEIAYKATSQLIVAFILLAVPGWAHAKERISDFSVEIVVQEDASMLVTESITVIAEHDAIKHGIFRSVPTLAWQDKRLRSYGLELLEARMDGDPVPCKTERGDLLTVFILGDPDKELTRGTHTFVLSYRTTGHVLREENGYAIHYNVTGNQWNIPIDKVTVLVTLPNGTRETNASASILRGTERIAGSTVIKGNACSTTRRMEPGEALIIHTAWLGSSISISEPTLREQLSAKSSRIMTAVGVFPLCCFVLFWFFFRRTPKRDVVPLYSAPKDISPGLAAHIFGKEENATRADLLWTAVRGFMRMQRQNKSWVFLPSWPRNLQQNWQTEICFGIADRLFSGRSDNQVARLGRDMPNDWSAVLSDNGMRLYHALGWLQEHYKKQMQDLSPTSWLLPAAGLAFNAAMLYSAMYFVGWTGIYDGMDLFDDFLGIVFCSLMAAVPMLLLKKGVLQRIVLLFFVALCALALGLWLDFERQFWLPVLSCVFTPLFFWRFFPSRLSPEGLKTRADVEGLAMYISNMKDRLSRSNAPEDTVEKYEELLPYAVALGLAETWEKRFSPKLTAASYRSEWLDDHYQPFQWEENVPFSETAGGYTSALASASVVAAAYGASQKESSGSEANYDGDNGGGSSGGGGGGGW